MDQLFTSLIHAIENAPFGIKLCAVFLWGILSLILSPCHLASIPLIVGFIDEPRDIKKFLGDIKRLLGK